MEAHPLYIICSRPLRSFDGGGLTSSKPAGTRLADAKKSKTSIDRLGRNCEPIASFSPYMFLLLLVFFFLLLLFLLLFVLVVVVLVVLVVLLVVVVVLVLVVLVVFVVVVVLVVVVVVVVVVLVVVVVVVVVVFVVFECAPKWPDEGRWKRVWSLAEKVLDGRGNQLFVRHPFQSCLLYTNARLCSKGPRI